MNTLAVLINHYTLACSRVPCLRFDANFSGVIIVV